MTYMVSGPMYWLQNKAQGNDIHLHIFDLYLHSLLNVFCGKEETIREKNLIKKKIR